MNNYTKLTKTLMNKYLKTLPSSSKAKLRKKLILEHIFMFLNANPPAIDSYKKLHTFIKNSSISPTPTKNTINRYICELFENANIRAAYNGSV